MSRASDNKFAKLGFEDNPSYNRTDYNRQTAVNNNNHVGLGNQIQMPGLKVPTNLEHYPDNNYEMQSEYNNRPTRCINGYVSH